MHIYFSGIGGVGIGPLAMIALDAGYEVSGSDLGQSEMTELLIDRGAKIYFGQDGSEIEKDHQVKPIDWFIYSSALALNHPELRFAKEHNLKVTKRGEFLNQILKDKNLNLIAVSGTHGKTTTTGMLVWAFKQLGLPISYSIGTTISFGPPAQYENGSKYFIYECDEFDKNFLHFNPALSLIVSLDYDHADTYPDQDAYNNAFNEFIAQSSSSIIWQTTSAQLGIKDQSNINSLNPTDPGQKLITLPGEHTRRNAWLVVQALQALLNIDLGALIDIMNNFPGTNRRFEKLAENLYTDYAHHPVEIAATIQMANEINQNVVVVYQPHQNIRQHELVAASAYADCFQGVKKLYWLPTYLSREYKDLDILSSEELAATVDDRIELEVAQLDDQLWEHIDSHRKAGDLVLAMSAGDLDGWLRNRIASKK